MSDDREFLRATTDWLEAGSDRTPPKAVDAVLLAIRTTRQDRVLRNPWRPIDMNALVKALVVATAVVAIALAWYSFGPSGTSSIGVLPVPTPTPSPSPTPQVLSSDLAAIDAGRRYEFPIRGTNPKISFTTPSGWTAGAGIPTTFATKDYGDSGPVAPLFFPQPFDHGFKDPCTDHTPVVPAAGSGAAGLLAVIAAQPGIDAGPITDVAVGGHDGQYVDYTVTTDPATCGNGQDGFWIWGTCPPPVTIGCEDGTGGDRRYGVTYNDRERAYAIDVNGVIVTFFGNQPADLTAADRAEFQQVLDSIRFEAN